MIVGMLSMSAKESESPPHGTVCEETESPEISATAADWSRERKTLLEWAPSRSLLACIRAYQAHAASKAWWSAPPRLAAVLRHHFWSVVTGADIPLNCRLGGGLLLPHPNGIVIHPDAEIGPNCLLFQQVTVGAGKGGVPKLEGHVDVGAGAKILGAVTIGAHAKIGANAVVVSDVPSRATAVGVPAKIVPHSQFTGRARID
jgi:serine O-acetyltransferase